MNVTIYTKSNCPNCVTAKNLLKSRGLKFAEVNAEKGNTLEALMALYPDARQMPQIFVNGQRVGGLAGLQAVLQQAEGQA